MANFSERLKALRSGASLSQEGLAKRLKVTRSCIGNYEQGKREPSFEDLEKIADFFNVDMEYLIGRSDVSKTVTFEPMTEDERMVLQLYRQDPSTRDILDRMLAYRKLMNNSENRR